jgi:hypothetical protein
LEALLVRERLGSALQVGKVHLLLPGCGYLELLHLVVALPCCLVCFESESKDAEGVVDVHL